jgi:SAM-dependent methyltransferase
VQWRLRRYRSKRRKARAARAAPAPVTPAVPAPVFLTRAKRLAIMAEELNLAGVGLEIGASHNPLLLKSEGHDIRIADHLDQAGLIAKYEGLRPTGRIEHVDYVLKPGRLTESIDDRFDYILASHLLEHTVCMISFLQDCQELLKPGGVLSLALPDKRYCFDRLRERTSLGRVIDVYHAQPLVHSYGSVIEHNLNMVTKNLVMKSDAVAWYCDAPGELNLRVPLQIARQRADTAASGIYVDTHNWVLTPHHFRLLVHDLFTLGYIDLHVRSFTNTIDHEFFVQLWREAGPPADRRELLRLAAEEQSTAEPAVLV